MGEPANETGVLLWSGADLLRYLNRSDQLEVESFKHLLTLDFSGQVVAWHSMQSDDRERRWLEVAWQSIENLNRHIRDVEPLRYR
ncbi:MAG: hypothetical protein R6X17_13425 [Candidatus Competibacteraceae bacterium]